MHKIQKTGVPYYEHPAVDRLRDLNWETIRIFLCLGRTGSFRAAAQELGIATNTVRRSLEELEREVGGALASRSAHGIELSAEGLELYSAARQMEIASFDLQRIAQQGFSELRGPVRISVTEGIGTFWLMPRLTEFQRSHPKIMLELNCTMRLPDLGRVEADIGIQIERPTNPELKFVKLGRMHAMPFAAKSYLGTYGRPGSIEEIKRHRIVQQLSPQLVDIDAVERLFPDTPRAGFIAVTTNTSTAHFWAVANGAGLGMLPTYLAALGAQVEPVEVGLRTKYDIYMVYHPTSAKVKRVTATMEWLRRVFDPKVHPCFRDDFVAPEELRPASVSRSLGGA
jgi:DNA-binding transcriptional LysR family regulator